MEKTIMIEPEGWKCKFKDCRPGFFVFDEMLFLKSEYGGGEAYCDSGESFWGGVETKEEMLELMVQPVTYRWVFHEGTWDKDPDA